MPCRFFSRNLAPLTLLGATIAFLHPPAFLVFKDSFLWFFAATMFALGLVLEPVEAKAALNSPWRIIIGVVAQFSVMPLLGFVAASIAVAAGLTPALALGFVIVACAPGAMASNVIVFLAGGAVAYSIALTTVATLLSPLLTPSLVEFLGGVFLSIPFWPMMQTILITVVAPLALGMLLRPRMKPFQAAIGNLAPAVAAIAIIIICSYAVAANQPRIATMGGVTLLLVVALNALGYALGWLVAHLLRFDRKHKLALAIEISMQNAGLGVALALAHFQPETALPGALFAVWCILTAAAATRVLHRRELPAAAV